ncbi:MAG: hypothetical protein ACKODB_01605 [Betaproteobacteria bacterium]
MKTQSLPRLSSHLYVSGCLLLLLGGGHAPTFAQFGNLLQQIQKALPQQPAQGQGMPGMALPPAQGQTAGNRRGVSLVPSERWCQAQTGALGRLKVDTGVIASEFKVADLDALQDDFRRNFRKGPVNRTFPGVGFFRASFETVRIRAIYDTFLAFPEPSTLAALIQLSRGSDPQERADAVMALTFIHLQAQELSVTPDRWRQLFQSLQGMEHYTMLVFKARMNAYGEYGPKNLSQALGDLVFAGGLPGRYREQDSRKEFDSQNYQTISTATALDIFRNEPNAPFRQQWQGPMQTGMQIEQAQQAFAQTLPNTRIGRMYAEANKLNRDAIGYGDDIIRRSQGGNQLLGQIEGLKSLRATAPGDKPVFEDVSADVQAEQLKMVAKLGNLDEEQKQLLVKAQEKRLLAQGIIVQSYGELFQVMTSGMGDLVKMAAPRPALTQANNALIQSCIISAKWEQAMRARDVAKPDMKKTEATVGDLQSRFKD